jgi:hypothetical protein
MATISDNLGVIKSVADPDIFIEEQSVSHGGAYISDATLIGNTQNALELVVVADTDIVIPNGDSVAISLLYGPSYASSRSLYSVTASDETTIDEDTELVRFVVPSGYDSSYVKVQMTGTDDAARTVTLLNELKDDLNLHMQNDFLSSTGQTGVYALLDELKVDLNAHMSNGTAHANADDVTAQVSAADATTKATAIALANAIRSSYEAHRVQLVDAADAEVHGAADATNVVTLTALDSDATWQNILELSSELRTDYEAHRVLITNSVHDAADSTNTVTATAVTGESAHTNDDDVTAQVSAADASDQATAITLVNAIRTAYEAHRVVIKDAATSEVHGAADATNTVTLTALASTADWDAIAALADELRADYEAHRVLTTSSVHANADTTNAVSTTAVGTAAYITGTVSAWTELFSR